MENDDSSSSCSSSELEDLPTISERTEPAGKKKFSKGDIVWADYNHPNFSLRLFWPALIQQVYPKERKVKLWYLDAPRRIYKIPYARLRPFKNGKVSEKIQQDAKQSPYKEQHEKLLLRTMSFLQRKSIGKVDDPVQFFDDSSAYFAAANMGLDVSSSANLGENADVDMDNKNASGSTTELADDEFYSPNCVSDNVTDDSFDETDVYTAKLVKCIVKGDSNQHVLDVYNGKISSEREKRYFNLQKRNRRELYYTNSAGIIKNNKQFREITDFLADFYNKNISASKIDKSDIYPYIITVWVPEAVTKAISIVDGISLIDAENVFLQTDVLHTKESLKNLSECVNKNGTDKLLNSLEKSPSPVRKKVPPSKKQLTAVKRKPRSRRNTRCRKKKCQNKYENEVKEDDRKRLECSILLSKLNVDNLDTRQLPVDFVKRRLRSNGTFNKVKDILQSEASVKKTGRLTMRFKRVVENCDSEFYEIIASSMFDVY